MRAEVLTALDTILDWTVRKKCRTYPRAHPCHEETIAVEIPEIEIFAKKHGYFSSSHPIVGRVTSKKEDVDLACHLLKILYEKRVKGFYLEIAVAEVLTKIIAYRNLHVGQMISIPIEVQGEVIFEPFIVDIIFDLWHGMPGFGLIPQKLEVASILLFRGTSFSLFSKQGWASVLSDLDPSGPGLRAFRRVEKPICTWLQKVRELGKGSRVMGFSLGGALAAYAFIYANAWVAKQGSVGICPLGISDRVLEDWNCLSAEEKKEFTSYVNTGDIVSKMGNLFGVVYALETQGDYKPLQAHNMLMCGYPLFSKRLIARS